MKNVGREYTLIEGISVHNGQILARVGPSPLQMFINGFVPLKVSGRQTQQTKNAAHCCNEGEGLTYPAVPFSYYPVPLETGKIICYVDMLHYALSVTIHILH